MKARLFDYSIRNGRLTPVIHSRKRLPKGPPQAWLALGVFLAALGTGIAQPIITNQPQSCTNIAGTTATFTVMATGTMPLAYQWQQAFDLFDYVDRPEGTNSTLVITNVQNADSGNYRVIVTNVDGAITSDAAMLTVLLPPMSVKVTPANSSVSPGANLTLRVTASGSTPFSYQWCLNSAPLGGQTNSLLNLTNIQLADAGAAYTVVVTNVAGAATSSVARLTVDTTFTKITTGDVVSAGPSYQALWGDLDNDGYLDLVVLTTASKAIVCHNNHDGTFSKMVVTGLPSLGNVGYTTTAALGDFDNDGYLDLFIGHPTGVAALFKNNGDGTFTNVTKVSSLIQGLVNEPGGAGWADYNNDGCLNLFVGEANGSPGSGLFQNNGNGAFSQTPPPASQARGLASTALRGPTMTMTVTPTCFSRRPRAETCSTTTMAMGRLPE